MRQVLVLRPEPGASRTVERARNLGLDALAVPLFEIEAMSWEVPDPALFDAILLTSANSVRTAGVGLRRLRGLPVYAVGEATAKAAREAGFDIAATGEVGVDRLLGSIDSELDLVHLCGEDRREPNEAPQAITPIAVYRAKPIDSPDLSSAKDAIALVHSPRSAGRLAELVSKRESIAIAAISRATARAAGRGWERVEYCAQPNDDALLALAARLCDKPHPK
jgi:uroporphyrinogen-III synthase